METTKNLFRKYAVQDVKNVAEFCNKYYKPERFQQQGEQYMKAVLDTCREEVKNQGYTIISKHDSITGKVVSFYPDENSIPENIQNWIDIGKRNPWIREATDPIFGKNSFYECESVQELKDKLESGNWSLGSAFYYNDICFINQVNAGDEWLVIKGNVDFESVNAQPLIRKGKFESLISRIENATDKQLKKLEY